MHRRVKNQRLANLGYLWAFAALTASPGARAHYDWRASHLPDCGPHRVPAGEDLISGEEVSEVQSRVS
jgi:hypothetical protein